MSWNNSGSVDVTFYVGDLRPRDADICDDGKFALLMPASSDVAAIRGIWEVTARNHNKVYQGALAVPVTDRDFTTDLRSILGLVDGKRST